MRRFNRTRGDRKLFMKSMAANLVMRERIQTTTARAKEVRPLVEKFVTIAKKQNLASLRTLLAKLPKDSAEKMYYDIAPRYKERHGGYLRITKHAKTRKRDGAAIAVVEFVK